MAVAWQDLCEPLWAEKLAQSQASPFQLSHLPSEDAAQTSDELGTLLHVAAALGHLPATEYLLGKGPATILAARTSMGRSVLDMIDFRGVGPIHTVCLARSGAAVRGVLHVRWSQRTVPLRGLHRAACLRETFRRLRGSPPRHPRTGDIVQALVHCPGEGQRATFLEGVLTHVHHPDHAACFRVLQRNAWAMRRQCANGEDAKPNQRLYDDKWITGPAQRALLASGVAPSPVDLCMGWSARRVRGYRWSQAVRDVLQSLAEEAPFPFPAMRLIPGHSLGAAGLPPSRPIAALDHGARVCLLLGDAASCSRGNHRNVTAVLRTATAAFAREWGEDVSVWWFVPHACLDPRDMPARGGAAAGAWPCYLAASCDGVAVALGEDEEPAPWTLAELAFLTSWHDAQTPPLIATVSAADHAAPKLTAVLPMSHLRKGRLPPGPALNLSVWAAMALSKAGEASDAAAEALASCLDGRRANRPRALDLVEPAVEKPPAGRREPRHEGLRQRPLLAVGIPSCRRALHSVRLQAEAKTRPPPAGLATDAMVVRGATLYRDEQHPFSKAYYQTLHPRWR